jgi:hypothetical protein
VKILRRVRWLPLTGESSAARGRADGRSRGNRFGARAVEARRPQERQLRELAALYFDGLSVAVLPAALRNDVWEAFDALDRATHQERSLSARVTTLATDDGEVVASRDPSRFPTGSRLDAGRSGCRRPTR